MCYRESIAVDNSLLFPILIYERLLMYCEKISSLPSAEGVSIFVSADDFPLFLYHAKNALVRALGSVCAQGRQALFLLLMLVALFSHLLTDVAPTPSSDSQSRALGTPSFLNPPCGSSHVPCTEALSAYLLLPFTRVASLVNITSYPTDRHILPLLPPPRFSAF